MSSPYYKCNRKKYIKKSWFGFLIIFLSILRNTKSNLTILYLHYTPFENFLKFTRTRINNSQSILCSDFAGSLRFLLAISLFCWSNIRFETQNTQKFIITWIFVSRIIHNLINSWECYFILINYYSFLLGSYWCWKVITINGTDK